MGARAVALLRLLVALAAAVAAALAQERLEGVRAGLEAGPLSVPGGTPATVFRLPGAGPAPVVVIAHGFAGSRQLMLPVALTLARAGYIAVTYDLAGHGASPVPMSGDVTRIEGATRRLIEEAGRVATAALALPGADGRLALFGHSMASDVVVRLAVEDSRVGAVVALSMFSEAVTATAPRNLLVVAGAWEGFLAREALAALRRADPAAAPGRTVGAPEAGSGRRAVLAPGVEHVGVLYSATMLAEARGWLDAAFGRQSAGPVAAIGGWVALLLVALAAAAWPLAGLARRLVPAAPPPARLPAGRFLVAALLPALAVPVLLRLVDTRFLPVLVADYLAVHLLAYGAAALGLMAALGGRDARGGGGRGGRGGGMTVAVGIGLAVYGIAVWGGALHAWAAGFRPAAERWPLLAALAAGAVPFMLADAVLTEGGRAPAWRALVVRGAFLASLGLAVALDFGRLFFLVIILPVILLFFLLFGTMGGWVGRATGRPAAAGLGLGLILAWALGATFPLFAE